MTTCPESFFDAYVECALWSSYEIANEPGATKAFDCEYTAHDIDGATLDKMLADCNAFWEAMSSHIADCEDVQSPEEQAGHDFWLTRCGHGAGFWDGDWPEPQASRLTAAAKTFGNVDLYVGDDGKIYA